MDYLACQAVLEHKVLLVLRDLPAKLDSGDVRVMQEVLVLKAALVA